MRQVITGFGGAVPRFTDFGIPETFAVRATNCKVVSGEVRGIHTLTLLHDFGDPDVKYAYRIPGEPEDTWIHFHSLDAVVIRSPITNDAFDRYYFHEPGGPIFYNTLDRIKADDPPFLLGIPAPVAAPAVAAAGGTGDDFERVYVYTFVSAYGEEGSISPTSAVVTGKDNGTWSITGMDTTVPDAAERNITSKNIYRTVVGASGSAEFFLVANVPLATANYDDSATNLEIVSGGSILLSTMWTEPPADLDGIVPFPGGIILGWKDKTVYMSVPYRPWAWPDVYQVAVEQPIVGIGVTGNIAVIATQGHPFALTMTVPEAAALEKIQAAEPCLSRGSIIGSPEGVFYASQNGLMMFGPTGFTNASKALVTKEEWLRSFNPYPLRACRYQTDYIGITAPGVGYVISAETPQMSLVELTDLLGAVNVFNDIWSGEVLLLSAGRVYKWDDALTPEVIWRWATKRFFFPYEINIGAARVGTKKQFYGDLPPKPDAETMATIHKPGIGSEGAPPSVIPNLPPWAAFRLRVYADGALMFDRMVKDPGTIKLPDGFKAQDWQFEIYGRRPMAKFEFAETSKELAQV